MFGFALFKSRNFWVFLATISTLGVLSAPLGILETYAVALLSIASWMFFALAIYQKQDNSEASLAEEGGLGAAIKAFEANREREGEFLTMPFLRSSRQIYSRKNLSLSQRMQSSLSR